MKIPSMSSIAIGHGRYLTNEIDDYCPNLVQTYFHLPGHIRPPYFEYLCDVIQINKLALTWPFSGIGFIEIYFELISFPSLVLFHSDRPQPGSFIKDTAKELSFSISLDETSIEVH